MRCRTFQTLGMFYAQGNNFCIRVQNAGTSVPAFSPAFPNANVLDDVQPRGGRLLGPGTRLPPPPPLRALRAHLVTKGQWLLAIHRVAPKAPENFGDPRECRGCAKGAHLGQSLNARFATLRCCRVTP